MEMVNGIHRWGQVDLYKEEKMSKLIVLSIVALLSGCAGMDFNSPERWVENNTMYSTKLPSIEVNVVPSLSFKKAVSTDSIAESSRGIMHTGKDTDWFYFVDNSQKKMLNIKIESLTAHSRWYVQTPDYSQDSSALLSNNETIGGIKFATGVLRDKYQGVPVLIKAFGAVVGDTTRYQLFYMEQVSGDWLEKYTALLSKDDRDYIDTFNKRANESFSISSYSGIVSPTKRTQ